MNKELAKNSYIKIPKFITKTRAAKLRKEFTEFCKKENMQGDQQAPNSAATYNYLGFLELLCEKVPELSKIVETTLLPTYTYARVYGEKSVLVKHKDRHACEISITLHLGGDAEWPIYIETPAGVHAKVDMEPGDAMVYLGCDAFHWRDEFQGKDLNISNDFWESTQAEKN